MRYLMEKVANVGTGRWGVRTLAKFKGSVAGKTGTTSGWYDAWFAGFTPELTGVLWMGFDRRTISLGRHQSGGTIASPLWGRIFKDFYKKSKTGKFNNEKPKGVYNTMVCKYTGLRPKENVCTKLVRGFFTRRKRIRLDKGGICDGEHKKSIKFEEFLQKKFEISDEEINKKSGFKD